jgi:signal transduction histidine kinase
VERHARASRVEVTLAAEGDEVVLAVRDDGAGLPHADPDAWARAGHYGLLGMRERAAELGGRLDLGGATGAGATVALRIPSPRRPARRPRALMPAALLPLAPTKETPT